MDNLIGQPARMTGRELANQRASSRAVFELQDTARWLWLIVHVERETLFFYLVHFIIFFSTTTTDFGRTC